MDEKEFYQLSKTMYNIIFQSFDEIDPDEAEADLSSDNIRISFADNTQFIVNRQLATRQIWLATKKKGYHFNYDLKSQEWICDKTGQEFFILLENEVTSILNKPFKIMK